MTRFLSLLRLAAAVLVNLFLIGCGGASSDAPIPIEPQPGADRRNPQRWANTHRWRRMFIEEINAAGGRRSAAKAHARTGRGR